MSLLKEDKNASSPRKNRSIHSSYLWLHDGCRSGFCLVVRFCPGKDVLDLIYDEITRSEKTEYEYLREAICDCLKSHLEDYKVEIKRKLYEIATEKSSDGQIKERAIDLLYGLSGLRKKIIA